MSHPDAQAADNHQNHTTAAAPAYEPGFPAPVTKHSTPNAKTTQAERAVMHPEHHDPDWSYYHAAGLG